MIVEYVRYRIPVDAHASFLAAYGLASQALDASEHCLGYELTQCEEEEDRFILRMPWTSTEDHLKKFRSSPEFAEFLPHVRPFISHLEEMQHYRLTSVTSDRSGAG